MAAFGGTLCKLAQLLCVCSLVRLALYALEDFLPHNCTPRTVEQQEALQGVARLPLHIYAYIPVCTSNEVEDVTHWLLRCPAWNSLRQPLLPEVRSHTEDAEGTAHLLSLACRNYNILSTIMSMWYARFGKF